MKLKFLIQNNNKNQFLPIPIVFSILGENNFELRIFRPSKNKTDFPFENDFESSFE